VAVPLVAAGSILGGTGLFFASAGDPDPTSALLQASPIFGPILVGVGFVCWWLIRRLERALNIATLRGDRLEAELAELNKEVRDSMVDTLSANNELQSRTQRGLARQLRRTEELRRENEELRAKVRDLT
jgi:hypothetical protein